MRNGEWVTIRAKRKGFRAQAAPDESFGQRNEHRVLLIFGKGRGRRRGSVVVSVCLPVWQHANARASARMHGFRADRIINQA